MLALLLLIVPHDPTVVEHCDLMEHNHFYDDCGRHVFDQVIYWDWRPEQSAYRVRAWRMVKHPSQIPQRDYVRGGYAAVWCEGELELRDVRADSFRETWEQYDPELVDREYLPKERRRGLKTGAR